MKPWRRDPGRGAGGSRRQFLSRLTAGLSLGTVAAIVPRAGRGVGTATQRPRYWIQIVASGGLDAVWTLDPRAKRSVRAGVNIPYARSAIAEAGNHRFGPHFASLTRHAERLTVVNGVLVKAANHYTGAEQISRLRTRTTARTPSCLDIVGAHRDSGQAVAHVILDPPYREGRTPGSLGNAEPKSFGGGEGLLEILDTLDPETVAVLEKSVATQVASLHRRGDLDYRQRQMLDSLGQTRALLKGWRNSPKFSPTPWKTKTPSHLEEMAQRALWLIENDLAATVTVFSRVVWDTHAGNTKVQSMWSPGLAALIGHLLDALGSRRNRHGRLVDTTNVIVASEIGRFPYLNRKFGKDHFPQIPMLLSGPSFVGNRRWGVTGKEMEAHPISPETGHAQPGERLTLDDIGYTALRAAGIDPTAYGVLGRGLQFLSNG